MSVAGENTTSSLDDFNEEVINNDGWESVIGDVIDIGNDFYTVCTGGGQSRDNLKAEYEKLLVSKEDLKIIEKAWEELHIKEFDKYTEQEYKLLNQVIEVFKKYKQFETEDLGQFIGKEIIINE
jgi:hypothetical protein